MATFSSVTSQQLTAVLRCRGEDLSPLTGMFEEALDATMKTLVMAIDPSVIYRLQGRAQVLKDFLELVNTGDKILHRLK